jgi:hypothetical protein
MGLIRELTQMALERERGSIRCELRKRGFWTNCLKCTIQEERLAYKS